MKYKIMHEVLKIAIYWLQNTHIQLFLTFPMLYEKNLKSNVIQVNLWKAK